LKASKCQNLALRYQQDATDYRKAIFMYEKAIENWKQCMDNGQLNCAAQIGQMHREISEIYRRNIKDDSLADQHHELAMHFSKDALQKANSEKEMSKILDSLHTNKMDFTSDEVKRKDIGLETIRHLELSWQSFREQRPFLSSQILSYLLKIADTPHSIRQFEEALTIYHQILAVHNQQNEALDLSLYIDAYQQIVGIYIEHKEDYLTALNFQLMAHKLILKNNVIEADDDIEEIAWKNEKTSESHLTLTEIYIKLQQYNLAQENLYAARKIYQQIDIRKKEENIAAIDEKLRSIQKFLPEEPVIYTE
jgi:tetratricopeptide (TPR) repeat protein